MLQFAFLGINPYRMHVTLINLLKQQGEVHTDAEPHILSKVDNPSISFLGVIDRNADDTVSMMIAVR